ncbi:MAG: DUF488 domain-containing protein [Deltaproteobacteria bacterium]|nr:DUF488 domain-containing protein [Deltaproteobacteria bacterium]
MEIYTIGFTKKSAAEFFETLKRAGIKRLIDIRLNNQSQLAGFTKQDDLNYFLKELGGIEYVHDLRLAPTQEIIGEYRQKKITWDEYESRFINLLKERKIDKILKKKFFSVPSVLLCSEPEPDHCHRRLVAEFFSRFWNNVSIIHL